VADDSKQKALERQLLADFDTYDQHVDVVSAFEWVFTDPGVKDMPATVRHFERFPRVTGADGTELSPDFTVLFHDGMVIIGEVAKLALPEESVDRLCDQIGKYATVTRVPDRNGKLVAVNRVDVMQLVEMTTGMAAYHRIIERRYLDPDHPYRPPGPPCIVQFSRTDTVYVFQRLPHEHNGTLFAGERDPHIQKYLDGDFKPPVSRFAPVKIGRAFINDQIDPLYLATHLITRTWPTRFGSATGDITVNINDTTEYLRTQYGYVRARDVKRALELLGQVGLAAPEPDGAWLVARKQLGRSGNRDVHKLIASRLIGNPRRLVTRRPRDGEATPIPGTLFDL
jgi:hypothetical protein